MNADRILILIPHPDDEVVGAAAAIGRARADGARVFGLYLTTGVPEMRLTWTRSAARHAARVRRRREEAERAAAMLGLEPVAFLDHPTRTLRLRLAEALGTVESVVATRQPGAIWVPAFEGGHQDHDAANALASRLSVRGMVWEFAEYGQAGGVRRRQEFPFRNGAERVVTLSPEETARKRELLAVFESEKGNLAGIGVERESFRPLPDHDYAAGPHPGTPYYARFQWVPFRHPRVDFTPPAEVTKDIARFIADQAAATDTASRPLSP